MGIPGPLRKASSQACSSVGRPEHQHDLGAYQKHGLSVPPDLHSENLHFTKIPRVLEYILQFEKFCSTGPKHFRPVDCQPHMHIRVMGRGWKSFLKCPCLPFSPKCCSSESSGGYLGIGNLDTTSVSGGEGGDLLI